MGHACCFAVPNSALDYMVPLEELGEASPQIIFNGLNDARKSAAATR